MIVEIEVQKSGGECKICNSDLTDFLKYEFVKKENKKSYKLTFQNKRHDIYMAEGDQIIRVKKSTGMVGIDRIQKDQVKMFQAITAFLFNRWNSEIGMEPRKEKR